MTPEQFWRKSEQLKLLKQIGPVEWKLYALNIHHRLEMCEYSDNKFCWVVTNGVLHWQIEDYLAVATIRRWLVDWMKKRGKWVIGTKGWGSLSINWITVNQNTQSNKMDTALVEAVKHILKYERIENELQR